MKLISYLGLTVAVIPFLGVPNYWKTIFFIIVGITIFFKAYLLKSEKKDSNNVFKQNNPEQIRNDEGDTSFNDNEKENLDSTDNITEDNFEKNGE